MPIRQLPIQLTHPDGVDSEAQNTPNNLAPVAYSGDYNDLSNKPSNSNISANSIFEPLNSEQPTVVDSRLRFVVNKQVGYNTVFMLKIYNDISNVNSFSGIALYYNNSVTHNFSNGNIRAYSEEGTYISDNDNTYYKTYMKYKNDVIICYSYDGILYLRNFNLRQFILPFSNESSGYVNKNYLNKTITSYNLMNKRVGQMWYVQIFNKWIISNTLLFDMSSYEFGIVAVTGNEHVLEETAAVNSDYTSLDGMYCVGIEAETQSLSSPLLLCVKDRQAKTFLIQKVTINNGWAYKLFNFDYFKDPFGGCYLSTYNGSSYLVILLPYDRQLPYSSSITFMLETQLEADTDSDISYCIIIGKDTNNVRNKPIYLNQSAITSGNPLKKDHRYICAINSSHNVFLTSH